MDLSRPNLESELLELLDQGIIIDRSEKPIRPTVTIVASAQVKRKAETVDEYEKRMRVIDAGRFVRELWGRYPNARLVLSDRSSAEKAAIDMAELLEMPVEILERGEKGAWDDNMDVLDERIVARSSHVVILDDSARSEHYQKLAERMIKHVSKI